MSAYVVGGGVGRGLDEHFVGVWGQNPLLRGSGKHSM